MTSDQVRDKLSVVMHKEGIKGLCKSVEVVFFYGPCFKTLFG